MGSQCTAAIIIGSSAIFADKAYQISMKYGFDPKHDLVKKDKAKKSILNQHFHQHQQQQQQQQQQVHSLLQNKNENIIKSSMKLFQRVPVLGAMFCEVIVAQCLSSLLNFQFVTEVKNSIINDEDRAGFTGNVSNILIECISISNHSLFFLLT